MALSLSAAASSLAAGRPLLAQAARALGGALSQARGFASGSTSQELPQPTYTYMPPGSSMREPHLISLGDPVYVVDPKPEAIDRLTPAPRASTSKATRGLGPKPVPTTLQPQRPSSIAEPTYTYAPPGSSLREPLPISLGDPVYYVDPRPDTAGEQQARSMYADRRPAPAGEEKAAIPAAKKAASSPTSPTTLPKFDFSSISGKNTDDGRPVSYKMVDDMAQAPYVVNPATHSMREPKYVSVSDPKYAPADKPAAK